MLVTSPSRKPDALAGLTARDFRQIQLAGKSPGDAAREIRLLCDGSSPLRLRRPCTAGDGVVLFSSTREARLATLFQHKASSRTIVKFVAASGSGSRMFRALRSFLERSASQKDVEVFVNNLQRFAFFDELRTVVESRGLNLESLRANREWKPIVECLVGPEGLNYARLPKGLLPFHGYPDGPRTALEEHLVEAALFAKGTDQWARVHFTVSPDHAESVRLHVARARVRFACPGLHYETTVSVQGSATNSVALDERNHAARDERGKLILWPSGHGAVLDNLDALAGDIVFVRTLDNVLPDRLKGFVCFYRKVLGGYLIELESKVHEYLRALSSGDAGLPALEPIQRFAHERLSVRLRPGFDELTSEEKSATLYQTLNRPLRVCGVVPHTGDPGGAPFWVESPDGSESLRLVEEPEVNRSNQDQMQIWSAGCYFNPVDIVCSVRNFRGQPFHLPDYRDSSSHISVWRCRGSQQLRILERPGLWNGAMAHWNTAFVEIPRLTVHPVKSVLDLLNWGHSGRDLTASYRHDVGNSRVRAGNPPEVPALRKTPSEPKPRSGSVL